MANEKSTISSIYYTIWRLILFLKDDQLKYYSFTREQSIFSDSNDNWALMYHRAQYHQEKNQLFAVVAQCTIFFLVNAIIYRY